MCKVWKCEVWLKESCVPSSEKFRTQALICWKEIRVRRISFSKANVSLVFLKSLNRYQAVLYLANLLGVSCAQMNLPVWAALPEMAVHACQQLSLFPPNTPCLLPRTLFAEIWFHGLSLCSCKIKDEYSINFGVFFKLYGWKTWMELLDIDDMMNFWILNDASGYFET